MSQPRFPDQRFNCPPRLGMNLGAAVACLAGGSFCVVEALAGNFKVSFGLLIHLSVQQTQILCWAMSIAGFGAGAAFWAYFVLRLIAPQTIILAADGLFAPPRPWSWQNRFIRYADVVSASMARINNQNFLLIIHRGGKLKIPVLAFESGEVFNVFRSEFGLRISATNAISRAARTVHP